MPRVIKGDNLEHAQSIGRSAALNIANFAAEAERLISDAHAKASKILAEAQADAQRIRAEAQKRGQEEGYKRGLAEGQADGADKAFEAAQQHFQAQTAQLQQMFKQAIVRLDGLRDEVLQQARTEVLDLALEIAGKITRAQAAGDIEVAQGNVAKALEMISCAQQVQVKVCPSQLEQLREYASGFLAEIGMSELVTLQPDQSLAEGDVMVASRFGEVDARVQTQLDNIVRAITGREGSAE